MSHALDDAHDPPRPEVPSGRPSQSRIVAALVAVAVSVLVLAVCVVVVGRPTDTPAVKAARASASTRCASATAVASSNIAVANSASPSDKAGDYRDVGALVVVGNPQCFTPEEVGVARWLLGSRFPG